MYTVPAAFVLATVFLAPPFARLARQPSGARDPSPQVVAPDPTSPLAAVQAMPLAFSELLDPSPNELKPSSKLLGLNGKRVRMVGFMAFQEEAPKGAFYLGPRPAYNDEGGAGSADIPPVSVRVIVRGAKDRQIEFIPRPVEVTGILEVGSKTEEDGAVSFIRIILDRPEDIGLTPTSPNPK